MAKSDKPEAIMVTAKERGFYGGMIRDENSPPFLFDGPGDMPPWMAEVTGEATVEPEAVDQVDAVTPKGKGGRKAKAAEATQPDPAEPFADAPAPIDAPKGNGVKEALGVDPDWVAKPVAI